jgi:hypothetical protein
MYKPIDDDLQPLVAQLRARYPIVRIVEAQRIGRRDTGGIYGISIRYQAPLEMLKRAGLLSAERIAIVNSGMYDKYDSLGESFDLYDSYDALSTPGCHDLVVRTWNEPHERPRIALAEAKRVLKKIARATAAKP